MPPTPGTSWLKQCRWVSICVNASVRYLLNRTKKKFPSARGLVPRLSSTSAAALNPPTSEGLTGPVSRCSQCLTVASEPNKKTGGWSHRCLGPVPLHSIPFTKAWRRFRMNGKKFEAADHSDPTCLFELLDKSCFSHALPATAGVGGYNFT